MRRSLIALSLALFPAIAPAGGDHAHHVSEADGLRLLHVWTPARSAGEEALIYLELENLSGADTALTGGAALAQPLQVVGFQYGSSGERWVVLPALPLTAGHKVALEPRVLALRLDRLPRALTAGDALEIAVQIGDVHLDAHAEIGARNATAHSHAGHVH
ncbi:MAG: hypothetical protein Q4G22_05385 [Paracoccus sp. (in: a-proteobacteria)]|uniref:hypothetical protein n=1 Tax=Paracoccus sp. TaxID=267 RepID=UPI0026E08BC4|nr:hypothetical protein [Paracoccus sp. (in: a-proteobacteria)]MDO5631255.1 hypothetical protein [Paracoccus sp. (in: a-proteobacteria)]